MPHDLPKWWTVYYYFRLWMASGVWEKIKIELQVQPSLVPNRLKRLNLAAFEAMMLAKR
jgi:transposase